MRDGGEAGEAVHLSTRSAEGEKHWAMLQHRNEGVGLEGGAVCCLASTSSWALSHGAGHEPFLTQRGDHPKVSLHYSHPVAPQER